MLLDLSTTSSTFTTGRPECPPPACRVLARLAHAARLADDEHHVHDGSPRGERGRATTEPDAPTPGFPRLARATDDDRARPAGRTGPGRAAFSGGAAAAA